MSIISEQRTELWSVMRVAKMEVIWYLNFLLLFIQPGENVDFQLLPEIEAILLQARSSLQPLLTRQNKGFTTLLLLHFMHL